MESSEDVTRLRSTSDDPVAIEQLLNISIAAAVSSRAGVNDKNDRMLRGINDISTQLDSTNYHDLSAHLLQKSSSIALLKLNQLDNLKSSLGRPIYLNNSKRFFRCSSCNLESTTKNPCYPLVYHQLDSDASGGNDIQYAFFRPLTSNFTTDDLDLLSRPLNSSCECQDLLLTKFEQADLSPISEPLASTYKRTDSISQPFTIVNCKKPSKSGKKIVCYSITRLINFNTDYQVYQCIDRDNMDSFALKLIAKDDRGQKLVSMYEHLYDNPHPNLPNVVHILDDADLYYVIIDNIRGPLLSELVTSNLPGFFPKDDVKKIAREILQALKYLHSNNISLNNLCLENVAFNQPFEVGCDFDQCPSPNFSALSLPNLKKMPSITITNIDSFIQYPMETNDGTGNDKSKLPQAFVDNDLWCVGFIMYCLFQGISNVKSKKHFNPFNTSSSDNWDGLSRELDLCKRLLAIDPLLRVNSAQEALIHPLFHL